MKTDNEKRSAIARPPITQETNKFANSVEKRNLPEDFLTEESTSKRGVESEQGSRSLALTSPSREKFEFKTNALPPFLSKDSLETVTKQLGRDVLSSTPSLVLAHQAYRNCVPFMFLQVTPPGGQSSQPMLLDGQETVKKIDWDDPVGSFNRILTGFCDENHAQESPIIETLNMLVPWREEPIVLGSLSSLLLSSEATKLDVERLLDLRSAQPHNRSYDRVRGFSFLAFYHGIGVPKNLDVAAYMLSGLSQEQVRHVFTSTLLEVSLRHSADLLQTCLAFGAEVAPTLGLYPHLPLVYAIRGGKPENVHALLQAGADPRQDRQDGFMSALDYARSVESSNPEISALVLDFCKTNDLHVEDRLFVVQGAWKLFDREENEKAHLLRLQLEREE